MFDIVYPSSAAQAAAAEQAARSLRGRPAVQIVHNSPVGSVLVTLDRPRLVDLAESHDAVIELVYAVGDHVPGAGALLNVYGSQAISGKQLRKALAMGDERTLRDDPAFSIRMMVDVGIKALSPAVNDPTTAVQALDRIEDVLRYAAAKHLSVGVVTDRTGVIRLVYPTPTWEDLVELALDEIRAFGAGQYQVARRLRALLDALVADLPEHPDRPSRPRALCWPTRWNIHTARPSVPTRSSRIAKVSACRTAGGPVDTEPDGKGPGAPPSEGRDDPERVKLRSNDHDGSDLRGLGFPRQSARRRIRRRSRLRIPHTEMGESGRPNGSMNSVTGPACVGTVPSSTSIE